MAPFQSWNIVALVVERGAKYFIRMREICPVGPLAFSLCSSDFDLISGRLKPFSGSQERKDGARVWAKIDKNTSNNHAGQPHGCLCGMYLVAAPRNMARA